VPLSDDCTVVSLRQLERQLDREKEKSNTELTAVRAVHQDEVEKLAKQLQTLQSDNNLLLVGGSDVVLRSLFLSIFRTVAYISHTNLPLRVSCCPAANYVG